MSPGLEIVATGARTPVGLTAESSAAAVRAGIARGREYAFSAANGEPLVVAADARLDATVEGRERLVPMFTSVLDEVTRKLPQQYRGPYYLWLALPEARPGFSDRDASWVEDALRAHLHSQGYRIRVNVAGRGHAGTVRAAELALQHSIQVPDAIFLLGGVDSYHHAETFLWLEQNRQLTQAGTRNGFMPGEGAGCIALASTALRRSLRAPCLAVVRGASTAQEALLRTSASGSLGVGMSAAVRGAVAELALPGEAADVAYTDINGERYRSEEWGFVALRASSAFKSLTYEAPSDCWGDVGAAFASLASILAVQSFARGYARGPRALIMAGSENGLRGAMLLEDPRLSASGEWPQGAAK